LNSGKPHRHILTATVRNECIKPTKIKKEMKKMYEKPSVDVIAMETEQSMATLSSYNTTGDETHPGFDIIEGNPPSGDGTDLRGNGAYNSDENWAKPHNVWE
jgi:hypothetical protein